MSGSTLAPTNSKSPAAPHDQELGKNQAGVFPPAEHPMGRDAGRSGHQGDKRCGRRGREVQALPEDKLKERVKVRRNPKEQKGSSSTSSSANAAMDAAAEVAKQMMQEQQEQIAQKAPVEDDEEVDFASPRRSRRVAPSPSRQLGRWNRPRLVRGLCQGASQTT